MKKLVFLAATLFVTSLMANGEALYKKCAACHGLKGEKVALNKSKVIADMSKEDLVASLTGYKNGTYGGAMKGLMKGQVTSFSDVDIEKISLYIGTFK